MKRGQKYEKINFGRFGRISDENALHGKRVFKDNGRDDFGTLRTVLWCVYLNKTQPEPPALSEDAILVRNTLIQQGLETPMIDTGLNTEQKYQRIKELMSDVVATLGLDLSDDSLAETPHRIAKMYVHEIFSGLDYSEFPKLSVIDNKMGANEMVKVRNIDLTSTCEHHFVTIDGVAKVAYIPKDKIIGLSKINRLVQYYAKRPQVQERLTNQIANELKTVLETEDVAVIIDAKHLCVSSRGVKDDTSATVTTYYGGEFNSPEKIAELQNYINN